MCQNCYARQWWAENRDRLLAAQRARRKRRLRNDSEYAERTRERDRLRHMRSRGDVFPGKPRARTDVPCVICGTFPCVAKNLCQRCYNREHMRKSRRENPLIGQHAVARNAVRVKENREAIFAAKQAPCTDCGGTFPAECMDFDHIAERGPKLFGLSNSGTRTLKSVLAEIAKCDLICANCHRIRSRGRAKARGRNGMA